MSRVYWTGPNSGTTISGFPYKTGGGGRGSSIPDWVKDFGGIGSGSGSGSGTTPPAGPAPVTWSFPQYSQTWAFTPPQGPQTYLSPPRFDPSSKTGYAATNTSSSKTNPWSSLRDRFKTGDRAKSSSSKTSFDDSSKALMELWAKYGIK